MIGILALFGLARILLVAFPTVHPLLFGRADTGRAIGNMNHLMAIAPQRPRHQLQIFFVVFDH